MRLCSLCEQAADKEIQWDWLELRETPWGQMAFVLVGVLSNAGRLRCWFSESMDQPHLVAASRCWCALAAPPRAGEPTAWRR